MLTQEQLMGFVKSREFLSLSRAVLLATAFAQAERVRVDTYLNELLELYDFYPDAERAARSGRPVERITDHKKVWLSSDEKLIAEFCHECDVENRKHGFTGPYGNCPALIAETARINAEWDLIKCAAPVLGIDPEAVNLSLDNRKKFIDLLLTMAVNEHNLTAAAVLSL